MAAALRLLENLGIVREVTGRQRGRVCTYGRYLAVLRKGRRIRPGSSSHGHCSSPEPCIG